MSIDTRVAGEGADTAGPPVAASPDSTDPAAVRARLLERIEALPADAWSACPSCRAVRSLDQVTAVLGVCDACGHHRRLGAPERIASLVDSGSFAELDLPEPPAEDPLGFVDTTPYPQRLARARSRTGLGEAVSVGRARIHGLDVVLAVMDFRFMGGSMGVAVGERLVLAARTARRSRRPLVVVATSGGARMQEGVLSLWQMARSASEFGLLREEGVPSVCILTDPVYGGVAASFATLGDVILAEPGARAGFAGPGVIATTIGDTLPPGFQTAEFLLEHGQVDLVVDRRALRDTLAALLDLAVGTDDPRPVAPADGAAPTTPDGGVGAAVGAGAWETVQRVRDAARPTASRCLAAMVDGFVELHGDRRGADDPAVIAGVGRVAGRRIAVVAQDKGQTVAERVARRFGMAVPSGYAKAVRVARLAERWGLPVLTLIDTPGAYPGVDAERSNQSGAIAEAMLAFSALRTPVVGVVLGEGGSGGALALAVTDRLLVVPDAVLSVISPEGCASILFSDAARAPEMAEALRITARDLVDLGIADGVVAQPPGGLAADVAAGAGGLAAAVCAALDEVRADAPDPDALVRARRHRVRERTRNLPPAATGPRRKDTP
ncbi:MAG: carboxyl transferase domain-containing protein [Kineosporiaceae bacterium]